jgi:hypothetical protein
MGNVLCLMMRSVDYRIGGGIEPNGATPFASQELTLYRRLVSPAYFLSALQR